MYKIFWWFEVATVRWKDGINKPGQKGWDSFKFLYPVWSLPDIRNCAWLTCCRLRYEAFQNKIWGHKIIKQSEYL